MSSRHQVEREKLTVVRIPKKLRSCVKYIICIGSVSNLANLEQESSFQTTPGKNIARDMPLMAAKL